MRSEQEIKDKINEYNEILKMRYDLEVGYMRKCLKWVLQCKHEWVINDLNMFDEKCKSRICKKCNKYQRQVWQDVIE